MAVLEPPKVIEHTDEDFSDFYNEDWAPRQVQHTENGRRPIVYSPFLNEIHIGPVGATHSELTEAGDDLDDGDLYNGHLGWVGFNHESPDDKSHGWYHEGPDQVVKDTLAKHLRSPAGEGWHFAAQTPRVVEVEKGKDEADRYYGRRRPVIYYPSKGEVHVGPWGGLHYDLYSPERLPHDAHKGWIGENPEVEDGDIGNQLHGQTIGWYHNESLFGNERGHPGAHVDKALADHFGAKPASEGWHFATVLGCEIESRELDPGVMTSWVLSGPDPETRHAAHLAHAARLAQRGYETARFDIIPDLSRVKTSHWNDIMSKAQRLVAAGNVQMLRNSVNNVVAQVQGDNDTYQVEFSRDDPNSSAITTWTCECPWSQFSWGRTRQWKKYEGRVCSHCLATYWQSLRTPLDDDNDPANSPVPPPSQPPAGPPIPAPGPGAALQGIAPGGGPPPAPALPTAEMAPPVPQAPSVLPELPQLAPLPVPNSVPGAYLPSPANPTQYPGGTFSKVWKFAAEFRNGDVVQTNEDDWGTWVGRSDSHGSGQPVKIPKGSVGEVLGMDPATTLVQVLIMDKIADEMGKMQPYGATGWFLQSELTPRPDIPKPGPAVRRRR